MKIYDKKGNLKTVVIIPSYEPPHAFVDYARELLENGAASVIVVNDGSGEKYSDVYRALSATDGCTVIGYRENKGKGYALRTAFEYCKANFDDSYVFATADCDGQHLSSDVFNVAASAKDHPKALVLGARDFNDPSVPARSRSGNVNTRRIFRLLYGISLSDTQTGLRAFSYELLDELLAIHGNRFEYEMNMLIVLHKKHVSILEVPIATVYNGKSDDVERVSHFKTFSDGFKVFSTLLKNLGWYMISSVLSSVVDVAAFFVLFNFVLGTASPWLQSLLATVIARVVSSVVNFSFNFKFVFNSQTKMAVFKYYCLWAVQLGASYGLTYMWSMVFDGHGILVPLMKAITDLTLALLSYQIQNKWVFVKTGHNRLKFCGPLWNFSKRSYNLLSPKYRNFVVADDNKPAIYVSRHLNMKGPLKILQSIPFDCHLFALNCFTSFKAAYKQFSTYTFTARHNKRGIGVLFGKIKAFFAALYVAPLANSNRAIPVYRGGSDSMLTFRKALEYLERGENCILFPDVDYTAPAEKSSEIYSGFLFIDKLYFKKFGEHISFRVIEINDEARTINETLRIEFTGDEPFVEEREKIAARIHSALMRSSAK